MNVPASVKTELPPRPVGQATPCSTCGACRAQELPPLRYVGNLVALLFGQDTTPRQAAVLRQRIAAVPADCSAVRVCMMCGTSRGFVA